MKKLNEHQIQELISGLRKIHPELQTLSHELIDHVASMIEAEMEEGNSFEQALKKILSDFSPKELNRLRLNSDDVQSQKRMLLKNLLHSGIFAGIGVCLWVALEFVAFIIYDIEELGWFYGLISMFILAYFTHRSFGISSGVGPKNSISFGHLLLQGMCVTTISSIILFLFLIIYVHYINPNLIGLGGQIDPHNKITWSIIISMPIGLISEGLLVSLTLATIRPKKRIA